MHYKTNRQNHDFQIAYFIAGSCQTPDAAYSILCDQKESRSDAIKAFRAAKLREQAKVVRAQKMLDSADYAVRLEGEADLAEIEAFAETSKKNYDAALAELDFIERCIEKLQPLRKFKDLPDAQAHEAAQQEEWKLQLIHTAENMMLTGHSVPPDHYATMRMHPEFVTAILPALENTQKLIGEARSNFIKGQELLEHLGKKKFDLPKLLGSNVGDADDKEESTS